MPKRLLFIIESLGGGGAQNALSKLISEFQNNNLKLTLLTFKSKNMTNSFLIKVLKELYFQRTMK